MAAREILHPEQERIERDYRIPVDSLWPGTYWLASLAISSPEALLPEDEELAIIRSYIEFLCDDFYGAGEGHSGGQDLLAMPLAKDGGHNTVIFCKRQDGWGYRRMTWNTACWPFAYRDRPECQRPYTLLELLDEQVVRALRDTPNEKWEAWKLAHLDVFGARFRPLPLGRPSAIAAA